MTMRRFLVFVCLSIVLFISTSCAEDLLIKQGDYNADVIALHQKLSELGLYSLRVESPWGPESVEAVKLLQILMGVDETGTVRNHNEYDDLLAAEIGLSINLATGTEETVTVFPDREKTWCKPYPIYPTSETGMSELERGDRFIVSFHWRAKGADQAVDAAICLRQTGGGSYKPVGSFSIPVGDSEGICNEIFIPDDGMRTNGTGWLIGEIGTENRNIQITISNFVFLACQ